MKNSALIVVVVLVAGCGLTLFISCSRPTESTSAQTVDSITSEKFESMALAIQHDLPDYVKKAEIPDSLLIDGDRVLYGDFNADQKDDFASIVTNSKSGFKGVLIVHYSDKPEYHVFGPGKEIFGMTNLSWIGIFKTIAKGELIKPTLVDPNTGDIIGDDESKAFKLIGTGIFMHVDESEGGGILFWKGSRYDWYHIE